MTVPARISLVTLGVSDLARSTAFYEGLGWARSSASQEAISFFRVGGTALGLFARSDLAADVGVDDVGGGFRGVTLAINVDSPADADALVASWRAAGGRVVKEPTTAEWGGYSGYLADPDGHLWEVAHNPFTPIDDRGALDLP